MKNRRPIYRTAPQGECNLGMIVTMYMYVWSLKLLSHFLFFISKYVILFYVVSRCLCTWLGVGKEGLLAMDIKLTCSLPRLPGRLRKRHIIVFVVICVCEVMWMDIWKRVHSSHNITLIFILATRKQGCTDNKIHERKYSLFVMFIGYWRGWPRTLAKCSQAQAMTRNENWRYCT